MAAADCGSVFIFEGSNLQRPEQPFDVFNQKTGSARQLHRQASVQNIRRRHTLMDKARLRPDDLRQMGKKSDHIVLDGALDLVDPGDVESSVATLFPYDLGGGFRDDAEGGLSVGGVSLDLEPDAEFRLGRPQIDHLFSGVARYHGRRLNPKRLRKED